MRAPRLLLLSSLLACSRSEGSQRPSAPPTPPPLPASPGGTPDSALERAPSDSVDDSRAAAASAVTACPEKPDRTADAAFREIIASVPHDFRTLECAAQKTSERAVARIALPGAARCVIYHAGPPTVPDPVHTFICQLKAEDIGPAAAAVGDALSVWSEAARAAFPNSWSRKFSDENAEYSTRRAADGAAVNCTLFGGVVTDGRITTFTCRILPPAPHAASGDSG